MNTRHPRVIARRSEAERAPPAVGQDIRPGVPALCAALAQLEPGLVQMIAIEMGVTQNVDQLAETEIRDLRDHHGQERV